MTASTVQVQLGTQQHLTEQMCLRKFYNSPIAVSPRVKSSEKIVSVGKDDHNLYLRLQLDEVLDERDWTWFPPADVFEDVPEMVT